MRSMFAAGAVLASAASVLFPTSAHAGKSAKTDAAWPTAVAAAERKRCDAILKKLHVVAIPAPGVKEGACGAPAPYHLMSIGRSPEVVLSPPVVVNCNMVVALHKWVIEDLQPLAARHLKAPITKIETMSSYSCRNAYGRTSTRLSEHALANAIDIRGFVTTRSQSANVLADWGATEREKAAARLLASRKQDEKRQVASRSSPQNGDAPEQARESTVASSATTLSEEQQQATDREPRAGFDRFGGGLSVSSPTVSQSEAESSVRLMMRGSFAFPLPSKLGGPKGSRAAVSAPGPDAERAFLHGAHATACKIFGTTLGPEANAAHKNHFHVDMAPRKRGNYCE